MYIRVTNNSANAGRMYVPNTYTIVINTRNENDNWLIKQNGNSCGIINRFIMALS